MRSAADRGNLDLVKFFIEKGANNYQFCYNITKSQEVKNYLQLWL